MGKTYVVFKGRNPGIYSTWEETEFQVSKFSGNLHKSYPTRDEAVKAFTKYMMANNNGSFTPNGRPNNSGSSSNTASFTPTGGPNNSGSSSTTSSNSNEANDSKKFFKLLDAQLHLAHEEHQHSLKVAKMYEEIENQLKSLRFSNDAK